MQMAVCSVLGAMSANGSSGFEFELEGVKRVLVKVPFPDPIFTICANAAP